MEDKIAVSSTATRRRGRRSTTQTATIGFSEAEQKLTELLQAYQLDNIVNPDDSSTDWLEQAVTEAIAKGFAPILSTTDRKTSGSHLAHQFLQRMMYQINVLQWFSADRCSSELKAWRDRIESVWQKWELLNLDIAAIQKLDVVSALHDRVGKDATPPLSENIRLLRTQITEAGYKQLVAVIAIESRMAMHLLSHDASAQRIEPSSPLAALLLKEYGGDRFNPAQFSLYHDMLTTLDMNPEPEGYLELAPWELLAMVNQSCLQVRKLDHFLCYIGGLLYSETSIPARLGDYRVAAKRLNLPAAAMHYWEHEISVSIRHAHSLLENVILPLVAQYPTEAWKLVLGYDQQKKMSNRAYAAIARSVRAAERAAARANR
jgi:hypothetical protein